MSMSYIDLRELLPEHTISEKVYFLKNTEFILGQEYQGVFTPSNYFLRLLSKQLPTIILRQKPSWAFTLGKDIISQDVTDSNAIPKDTLCIVSSPEGFILGVAQKSEKKFRNIFDIGHYLRREKS